MRRVRAAVILAMAMIHGSKANAQSVVFESLSEDGSGTIVLSDWAAVAHQQATEKISGATHSFDPTNQSEQFFLRWMFSFLDHHAALGSTATVWKSCANSSAPTVHVPFGEYIGDKTLNFVASYGNDGSQLSSSLQFSSDNAGDLDNGVLSSGNWYFSPAYELYADMMTWQAYETPNFGCQTSSGPADLNCRLVLRYVLRTPTRERIFFTRQGGETSCDFQVGCNAALPIWTPDLGPICLATDGMTRINRPPITPNPTLQSLTLPDGRSYQFQYGPWGNLISVSSPDSAVTSFVYGDASTDPGDGFNSLPGPKFPVGWNANECPDNMAALLRRRLVSSTTYPNGSGNGQTTMQVYEGPIASGGLTLIWDRVVHPDSSITRTGRLQYPGGSPPLPLEVYSQAGQLDRLSERRKEPAAKYHPSHTRRHRQWTCDRDVPRRPQPACRGL
jgi:YD repeat-containing protein